MSEVAAVIEGAAPPAPPASPSAPPASPAPPAGSAPPAPSLPPVDRWQDKFLPEDMRNDETLAVYKDVPDVAKALVETKKWARGRIAVPGAEDATAFAEFAAKVRPEKPDGYVFNGADGKPLEIDESYRGKAFELGLHPIQAKALVEFDAQRQRDAISKITQQGKDELTAIELDLGPAAYTQRVVAVSNMLNGLGIDANDIVPALEQVKGAGAAMRALFTMAEKTGELAKVDGASVALSMGSMSRESAQKELDAMAVNTDPAFQAKLRDKTSPEYAKRRQILDRINKRD